MAIDIIHVVRIDVETLTTDLAGSATSGLHTLTDRHPEIAAGDLPRRFDMLLERGGRPGTEVLASSADWASMTDYAAAVAEDDEALAVSTILQDGPVRMTDASVVDMASRANDRAEEPLFILSAFPSILATHARIEIPSGLAHLVPTLSRGDAAGLWPGDAETSVSGADPIVIHLLVPGLARNQRHRLSQRLGAIGILDGRDIRIGDRAWSASEARVALDAIAAGFEIRYASRFDSEGGTISVEDGDAVSLDAVARDFVANARDEWPRGVPDDADVEAVCRERPRDPILVKALAEAMADPDVRAWRRRGLAY